MVQKQYEEHQRTYEQSIRKIKSLKVSKISNKFNNE